MHLKHLIFLALYTSFVWGEEDQPLLLEENREVTVNVILEPIEKVEVFPEIFEEVEKIPFRLGQSFKKGDVLLKMKNDYYLAQVKKTFKAVEFAQEDIKIKESLYKDKLISTLELLQTELKLEEARSNLEEAMRNYNATLIIAPFDGKIGAIHVSEFERPVRQKAMMLIFNDKNIIAKFIIPAHLLSKFKLGQTIPIYVKELDKTIDSKLIHIGAEINPISFTVNLEAEIDNENGELIPGMASFLEIK